MKGLLKGALCGFLERMVEEKKENDLRRVRRENNAIEFESFLMFLVFRL